MRRGAFPRLRPKFRGSKTPVGGGRGPRVATPARRAGPPKLRTTSRARRSAAITASCRRSKGAPPSHTTRDGGYVYRLNQELYLMDVTGEDSTSVTAGGALARRGATARERIGLLARIKPLVVDIRASLTSGRGDALSGNAAIDGYDQVPPGWITCGPLDSAKAGIRTDTSMSVSAGGSATVMGNPPVVHDPNVADSTFSKYGDVSYSQLVGRATLNLPGQNFSRS